jgi:DNA-binding protein H-NS
MATLKSLQAKIAQLQAKAEAIVKKDSSTVVAKIRDLMEKNGLTVADIAAHIGGGRKRGPKPGAKLAAKPSASAARYRDPKTGATWTGHGRAPAWIANAKDRAKFLIGGSSSAAVNVGVASKSKAAAKAASKTAANGKLPPKYRNPKTGETWSGHARPPAWIKDVKDRTKFLIQGEGSVEPKAAAAKKSGPAKKAAANKVAAKKTTAKKGVAKKGAVKKVTSVAKTAPAKKATVKRLAAKKAAATKAVPKTESAVNAPVVTTEATPMATNAE